MRLCAVCGTGCVASVWIWGHAVKKFILISFGFLGWTFYEMSGGDDFEPASAKLARLNPVTETVLAKASDAAKQPAPFLDTDPPLKPEVTRVSLNLATVDDVLRRETDISAATQAALAEVSVTEDTGVPRNVGTLTDSASTPAIIPSLLVPNVIDENPQIARLAPDGRLDIRTVSGSRVNVRGGPGTDYGVVGRLVQGDAVEILEDSGDGWVRMRPMDGGDEGWMADFLLTTE